MYCFAWTALQTAILESTLWQALPPISSFLVSSGNGKLRGAQDNSCRGGRAMSTETKALVRRLYDEVWNKRKLEVVNEIISPSHGLNDPHLAGSAVGPDAYKRVVTQFIAAFPDLRFTIEDVIAEKDKVVVSWSITGTHKREFRGIPATNRKISIEGITVNHIAKGKIIDSDVNVDYLGMMQQLGVVPPIGQPKTAAAR
jgi:steroid delta-isomerase-like uncharacterized protein